MITSSWIIATPESRGWSGAAHALAIELR